MFDGLLGERMLRLGLACTLPIILPATFDWLLEERMLRLKLACTWLVVGGRRYQLKGTIWGWGRKQTRGEFYFYSCQIVIL